jgi:glucosamine-6-phosphate deaminase
LTEAIAHPKYFEVGSMKVEVHPNAHAAGAAAALAAGKELIKLAKALDSVGVIFATGASQFEILNELTRIPHLPWDQIRGFHMDEYVDISADHPASFRRYLRERLTSKVRMKEFFEIDGSAPDPEKTSSDYASKLRSADPQLCFLGIGENGHLAFNDPPVANFKDPLDAKIVQLDAVCRQQQMAEGWFAQRRSGSGTCHHTDYSRPFSRAHAHRIRAGQPQGEDRKARFRRAHFNRVSRHYPSQSSKCHRLFGRGFGERTRRVTAFQVEISSAIRARK